MESKSPYPSLGLAGVGFAAFLVITNLSNLSANHLTSLQWLSIGIPLVVASSYIWYIRSRIENEIFLQILFWIGVLVGAVGDIGCFGGIYYLFKSASPGAAEIFLGLSIISYIALSTIDLGIDIYKSKEKKQINKAQQKASADS
jgi:hypothetical protein